MRHQATLRDLELDGAARQGAGPDHGGHLLRQLDVVQGFHRQVQPRSQFPTLVAPGAELAEGLLEERVGEALDEPVLLGHRDELHGRHEAQSGVKPARQHFQRHHAAAAQRDLGLKERHEGPLIDGRIDRFRRDGVDVQNRCTARRRSVGRQALAQDLVGDGLFQRAEHRQIVGCREVARGLQYAGILAAEQQDSSREPARGQVAQEFDTVHVGHVEVDHEDVETSAAVERRERFAPVVAGRDCGRAESLERGRDEIEHEIVVVDDKQAKPAGVRGRAHSRWLQRVGGGREYRRQRRSLPCRAPGCGPRRRWRHCRIAHGSL
ncbi:MAG: hypothetical protein M5U09_20495 [Gammaproteobacteria bacterium]|nr:hypothetical protein [Gammaproteobacteria bacterium]